jgi:hypothetical protein
MHRSLPTRYLDQCWVGGDKAVNVTRAAKQRASPPIGLNATSVEFAEAVTIQQITARSESAHDFVTSATNIAPRHGTEHIRNHDQVEWAGCWICLQIPFW